MRDGLSEKIILCQPDSLKGCSLCCGLFNFQDIGESYLSEFLNAGKDREKSYKTYIEYKEENSVREASSYICPYQGFLAEGKPGCLIHPAATGSEQRDRSFFASHICNKFLCPAHVLLTDEEKIFLIKNVDDWYIYTVAIADPESYSFIYNNIKALDTAKEALCKALYAHGENLSKYRGVIFSYSVPEYNINKKIYSLRCVDDARHPIKI